MNVLGIIPARFASTRFPGKALAIIDGKTMIRRVYEQAKQCRKLCRVVVATDHPDIFSHVTEFGEVVMTSPDHQTGTDRCAEAMEIILTKEQLSTFDLVLNIQGDEPYIHPEQLSEVIDCFQQDAVQIATLVKKISTKKEITDPNVVKVVFNHNHRVLLFTRSPVPFLRNVPPSDWIRHNVFFKHIGLYGFRPQVLKQLVQLPASSLEQAESLEQMRWLQYGFPIDIHETKYESISIDIEKDLKKFTNKTERLPN